MSNKVHAIAQEAIDCFPGGLGPHTSADAKKLSSLKTSLRALFGSPELLSAVTTLINLSSALAREGADRPARIVFDVAKTAIPGLEALTGANAHALASVARSKFDQFIGGAPRALPTRSTNAGGMSLLALRSSPQGSR